MYAPRPRPDSSFSGLITASSIATDEPLQARRMKVTKERARLDVNVDR
jgi:hypothetical protein